MVALRRAADGSVYETGDKSPMAFKVTHRFDGGLEGVLPASLTLTIISTREPITLAQASEMTEIIKLELEHFSGSMGLQQRLERLEREVERLHGEREKTTGPYR